MNWPMRIWWISIICSVGLLNSVRCYSENHNITTETDSLLNILDSKVISGEDKVDVLNTLAKLYGFSDPVKGIEHGTEAFELSRSINYSKGEVVALKEIGICHHFMDEYHLALDYYERSLQLSKKIDYKKGIANGYHNIGCIYDYIGSYDKALELFLKSIKLQEEIDDKKSRAYTIIAIGNIYRRKENYSEALKHYHESLEINKELGLINEIAYSLYSIGSVYENQGNDDKAMEYFSKSLQLQKQINEKNGMSTSYRIIGHIYERRSDFEKAFDYYQKSLDLAQEIKSRRMIIEANLAMGKLFIKLGEHNNAIFYLEEGLLIAEEISAKDLIRDCYYWISEVNYRMKNNLQAYQNYKLYTAIKDSIFNEQNNNQILKLQTQFETEKKEKENELLRIKEARNLEIINHQRVVLIIAGVGFIMILILVILVYKSNVRNKRANILLREKNQEIYNQKAELTTTLENLEKTQSQLIHAAKMASLGQLTAGVAHELNNPINFIHANVSPLERDINELISIIDQYDVEIAKNNLQDQFGKVMALKEKLDYNYLKTEIFKLLEGIGEGTHRTSDIVKGLRNFSRIDEDKYIKADIHEVIDSTLTVLKNKLKDRIVVHKEYGNVGMIECLPTKLGQVFMNIINNGIHAISGNGEIYVKTTRKDNTVRIRIKDTGQGMSKEIIKHIFEPFYTTKDVGQGTGLGLSISFGIIERHNGDIDVISEAGKGTEFIIILPAVHT
jgi:signal transduction histidine kinase/lipopolysaccharide biosynthesis regulator YciM